jgi:lysophospholipase L1-like esterase
VKTETTGALAAASNYLGQRRLTVASDGFGRPAAFIDGRQSVNAPAGAGTGIFIGTGAGQSVVYLGAVNTGAAAGSYGGFKIRQIRMSDSRRCPTRPLGAYSYAWAMPRGYVPPSNVYAFLGDSITQGIYSVAITEPFPAGAAANKGATYFGHNFGIGANSSDMILRRWRLDVRERKYSTMVLLAGINDVNGIIGSATTIANLDAIITEALSDGMTVIVLTLLPGGKTAGDPLRVNLDAINTWIRARAGITVLDAYALFDDGAGKMKVAWDIDGGSLHPNQTGQTQLAGLVSPALP